MKVDRLVGIIMTLLNRGRVGAGELAEMFEVSSRTIYRDIDEINMAGIPVRSLSGVGGGFEIMPEYKVDKSVFSTADLSAILTGLSQLSNMVEEGELANVLAKVRSFVPADRARDIEIKASRIHVDLSPWTGNQNIRPYLQRIKTAIEGHRLLSFEYIAHHGNKTGRRVEPYQLVLKGGHWYFYGYCRGRKDHRLFRLSRMLNLEMEGETFLPREPQKPVLEFEELLERARTEVKIRIHRSVLDRVLEFCDYDHFLPDGDQHYIVDFPFVENEYYYDILLSFGDKCECLSPPSVRAGMRERIEGIAAIYREEGPRPVGGELLPDKGAEGQKDGRRS